MEYRLSSACEKVSSIAVWKKMDGFRASGFAENAENAVLNDTTTIDTHSVHELDW